MRCKRRLNALAKSIDSCQPAQSAQADMNRNFSASSHSQHAKVSFCPMIQLSPFSSVGSEQDLRTGGCWFGPGSAKYSFRELMSLCDRILFATGFLSHRCPLFQQCLCGKAASETCKTIN